MDRFRKLGCSWCCFALGALGSISGIGYAALGAQDAVETHAGAKPGRIVVLGDSITAGYGLAPEEAYPALLQSKIADLKLPYTVVNSGLSGDTSAGGLRRIDWVMGPGAEVLILALGGNDGLRGLSPDETYRNLRGIIERARKRNPSVAVIIAGMEMPANMGRDYVEQFASVFPRLAKESHAAVVPFLLAGVGGIPELNQADLIHPNAKGQQKVAENVWRVLEGVLKKQSAAK